MAMPSVNSTEAAVLCVYNAVMGGLAKATASVRRDLDDAVTATVTAYTVGELIRIDVKPEL